MFNLNLSRDEKDAILIFFYGFALILCFVSPLYLANYNYSFYFSPKTVFDYKLYLHGVEFWEFFAILLTVAFSIIVLCEPDEKKGIREISISLFFAILVSGVAVFCLIIHWLFWYHLCLFLIVGLFARVDLIMFRLTENRLYKRMLFFIDIPIIISLISITVAVGGFLSDFPPAYSKQTIPKEYLEFFSGAIAFQFIIGNILILFLRYYDELLGQDTNIIFATLLVLLKPFTEPYKVVSQRRQRRNIPIGIMSEDEEQRETTISTEAIIPNEIMSEDEEL